MSKDFRFMSKEERKEIILICMISCAKENGVYKMTIADIAKCGKCSQSLVKKHFGGILKIREYVIKYGKEKNISEITDASIMDLLSD